MTSSLTFVISFPAKLSEKIIRGVPFRLSDGMIHIIKTIINVLGSDNNLIDSNCCKPKFKSIP